MRINIKRLSEIEGGLAPIGLLYSSTCRLWVVNYPHRESIGSDPTAFRTVVITEEDDHALRLDDWLHALEVTSECKLYSLKNEFTDHQSLTVVDLNAHLQTKDIPVNLDFGYGSSIAVGAPIDKLYIACYGSDGGGDKAILVVDTKNDRVSDKIPVNGRPKILQALGKEKILVAIINPQNTASLIDIDTTNGDVTPVMDLNFHPIRAVRNCNQLLLLELSKGIRFLDIERRELMDIRNITGVFDVAPTTHSRYLAVLLERTNPAHYVDRLAIYDLESGDIVAQERVSGGRLLKFIEGRLFFTEVVEDSLFLNEVILQTN